ncbi:prephenate dehydrogenase [Foetidibacter luteolus]|uniref:prephenate dehydrogenase n=1 Tax=Foetidibacter luteolus TaxID=2608880 RepID=UPI00129A3E8A|nr:prephenate dehydrogenase [Foetidibacter luteolus]
MENTNTNSTEQESMGDTKKYTVTVVGVGLIGGSMALALKEKGFAGKVIGVEKSETHRQKALQLGLVDEVWNMEEAITQSDIIILSVPVGVCMEVLPGILNKIDRQVVIDVGSTKQGLIEIVSGHPKRGRFVATHPMWGTEYSGPEAAVKGAFAGKANVICNKHESDADAVELIEKLYRTLGMYLVYMNAADHDVHVAYVSHISHITSFALANTVLEKEKEEDAIFELASAGFESTVRLAKSNPAMWVPVFMQNRENVLDVLNEHISQLRKFKACLEKENTEYLQELIENANKIRKIIK